MAAKNWTAKQGGRGPCNYVFDRSGGTAGTAVIPAPWGTSDLQELQAHKNGAVKLTGAGRRLVERGGTAPPGYRLARHAKGAYLGWGAARADLLDSNAYFDLAWRAGFDALRAAALLEEGFPGREAEACQLQTRAAEIFLAVWRAALANRSLDQAETVLGNVAPLDVLACSLLLRAMTTLRDLGLEETVDFKEAAAAFDALAIVESADGAAPTFRIRANPAHEFTAAAFRLVADPDPHEPA